MFAQDTTRARRRPAELLSGRVWKQPFSPQNSLPGVFETSRDAPVPGCRYPACPWRESKRLQEQLLALI